MSYFVKDFPFLSIQSETIFIGLLTATSASYWPA